MSFPIMTIVVTVGAVDGAFQARHGKDRMTSPVLLRIVDRLPAGLADMRAEASAEGYRFLERLLHEWEAGVTRFDRDGEALLAAHVDQELAAIGGRTHDPVLVGTLRLRRFYVRPSFRRRGVGRALAEMLIEQPRSAGRPIVVHAARGSSDFWEALAFVTDARDGHTHASAWPSEPVLPLSSPSWCSTPFASDAPRADGENDIAPRPP